MTTAVGDIISKLRDIEAHVLEGALAPESAATSEDLPRPAAGTDEFLALTGALELLVRDFAADYFAQRAELLAAREDLREARDEADRLRQNRDRIAIANTELALVTTTAIQWRNGHASDDELRTSVDALLHDPTMADVAKALPHEEPTA